MGIKRRSGLWIQAGPRQFNSLSPSLPDQLTETWHEWSSDDTQDLDFSRYWNNVVKYPSCRYYGGARDSWRFYFDTEAEMTAWLLGADLSPFATPGV